MSRRRRPISALFALELALRRFTRSDVVGSTPEYAGFAASAGVTAAGASASVTAAASAASARATGSAGPEPEASSVPSRSFRPRWVTDRDGRRARAIGARRSPGERRGAALAARRRGGAGDTPRDVPAGEATTHVVMACVVSGTDADATCRAQKVCRASVPHEAVSSSRTCRHVRNSTPSHSTPRHGDGDGYLREIPSAVESSLGTSARLCEVRRRRPATPASRPPRRTPSNVPRRRRASGGGSRGVVGHARGRFDFEPLERCRYRARGVPRRRPRGVHRRDLRRARGAGSRRVRDDGRGRGGVGWRRGFRFITRKTKTRPRRHARAGDEIGRGVSPARRSRDKRGRL